MHDNFSNFPYGVFVRQIVSRLVAAIPGSFVIHQNLNLRIARGFLDGARIFEADR